jgi:galactose mutarotase-like enzyme
MTPGAAAIEETTREGYPALTLRVGDLAATFVPKLGMIGASLEHRGEELLGQRGGLAAYEARGSSMGIPLLHPWANRLSGLDYDFAGVPVRLDPDSPYVRLDANGLPIHGLLAANPNWHVAGAAADERAARIQARLDFGAHPELLEGFPFAHEIVLDVALHADGLTIDTSVRPTHDVPVPLSFGFHPYFTLPGVPRADWRVELPTATHVLLDERAVPTGATETAEPQPGPLGDRTFDDLYRDLERPTVFALEGGGRRIETSFGAGYDFAQVYAPAGQELICFEPMTAPTNALVTGGPDLKSVEPGHVFTASFGVSVKSL